MPALGFFWPVAAVVASGVAGCGAAHRLRAAAGIFAEQPGRASFRPLSMSLANGSSI